MFPEFPSFDSLIENTFRNDLTATQQLLISLTSQRKPSYSQLQRLRKSIDHVLSDSFTSDEKDEKQITKSIGYFLEGEWYLMKLGGELNDQKAIKAYETSIKLGNNAFAMSRRAFMHQEGFGGPVDFKKAIELYENAITLGNPCAMNNLAFIYQNGLGEGEVNIEKAIELYKRAVELFNSGAMINLASIYKDKGGEANYKAAIELYDLAIVHGSIDAIVNRAWMHQHGLGCEVDYDNAGRLFDKAIKFGNADAMCYRAKMYQKGQGGPVNNSTAIFLFRQVLLKNTETKEKAKESLQTLKAILTLSTDDQYHLALALNDDQKFTEILIAQPYSIIPLLEKDKLLTGREKTRWFKIFINASTPTNTKPVVPIMGPFLLDEYLNKFTSNEFKSNESKSFEREPQKSTALTLFKPAEFKPAELNKLLTIPEADYKWLGQWMKDEVDFPDQTMSKEQLESFLTHLKKQKMCPAAETRFKRSLALYYSTLYFHLYKVPRFDIQEPPSIDDDIQAPPNEKGKCTIM